jgi:asparagine synthase (glutamine-hydrolysing)
LARTQVTVALSGDGGDELFCGYNRYRWAPRTWAWLARVPQSVRGIGLDGLVRAARSPALRVLLESVGGFTQADEKLFKLADRSRHARSMVEFYAALAAVNPDPLRLVVDQCEATTQLPDWFDEFEGQEPQTAMMYADARGYLPDDILCKLDRAAMAVSLETRAPFLDPQVVACAWRVPLHMKIRNGQSKWILRKLLDTHLPRELFERPKQGFAIPLDDWLRGPLRNWAESLLDPGDLQAQGYFRTDAVRRLWSDHLKRRGQWGHALWAVLMFQAWRQSRGLTA